MFLLSKSERYYYDADAIRDEPTGRTDPIRHFGKGPHAASHTPNYQLDGNIGRNKRSVWEISTAPFSEAHFATFPPALIEPCILAGCPEECCEKCGAPYVREIEQSDPFGRRDKGGTDGFVDLGMSQGRAGSRSSTTLRFAASCSCNAATVPGTCLDPFGGAGTTGLVADRLRRSAILIELNPQYAAMATNRVKDDAGMFAEVL